MGRGVDEGPHQELTPAWDPSEEKRTLPRKCIIISFRRTIAAALYMHSVNITKKELQQFRLENIWNSSRL